MKRKARQLFLLIVVLMPIVMFGQTSVNREWSTTTGLISNEIKHAKNVFHGNVLFATSNVISDAGDIDVMTIAYTPQGDTIWVATESGTLIGGDDYGVDISIAPDGSVIVVGAIENSGSDYDYAVFKYDRFDGSTVWSESWNGAGNGIDIPSDLHIDATGNIYITGGSQGSDGYSDFGTIKISSDGSFVWNTYYDYDGLHDGANSIFLQGGVLHVSGLSQEDVSEWDVALCQMIPGTGIIINTARSAAIGANLSDINGMAIDADNNIYVTGYFEEDGQKDIQTIKLTPALSLVWVKNFGGDHDDESFDLEVDAAGNVYVAGYTGKGGGKTKSLLIKYDSSGEEIWIKEEGNTVTANGGVFSRIALEGDNVYVLGTIYFDVSVGYMLYNFLDNGDIRFIEKQTGVSTNEIGVDLSINGSDVYVTGFKQNGLTQQMQSIKYSAMDRSTSTFNDPETGRSIYASNQLIIKINPDLIDHSEVDNLNKKWWSMDEIFHEDLVSAIDSQLISVCPQGDCGISVHRIFTALTTQDTVTTSRIGETVRIPKFWSTFVFEFAEGVDIFEASNELMKLSPDIRYSNLNLLGQQNSLPNDELISGGFFNGQPGLDGSLYTGIDTVQGINIFPAWEYETGKRYIKIALLETNPVMYDHEDFVLADSPDSTKIDGWDFKQNKHIFEGTEYDNFNIHATLMAGIIGAIRNNEIGMAGVAGGNLLDSGTLDSAGCSIYALNMSFKNPDTGLPDIIVDYVANAVVGSAMTGDSTFNYGVHIMNNSWGISQAGPSWYIDTNIRLLTEAYHFANRCGVVVVASRGNSGRMQEVESDVGHDNYPAVIDDDWIISVGGTGIDGKYHDGVGLGEEGDMDGDGALYDQTSRGWDIDVSAPSNRIQGKSTRNYTPDNTEVYNKYNVTGGTSAAAAFVSGTCGLLLSYVNTSGDHYENLAPEDVEFILQASAVDYDSIAHPGKDIYTGYGLLNAGTALQMVDKDNFVVKHFDTDTCDSDFTLTVYSIGDTVRLSEPFENNAGNWFTDGIDYVVDIYQIKGISNHDIIPGQEVLEYWPRHSSSNHFALPDDGVVVPRERVSMVWANATAAEMNTYVYQVWDLDGNPLGWWPSSIDDWEYRPKMAYTLYLRDTIAYATVNEEKKSHNISVYPNPSTDMQTLEIDLENSAEGYIQLLDIEGRLIIEVYNGNFAAGVTKFSVDLSNLSHGSYIYKVVVDDRSQYVNIIR